MKQCAWAVWGSCLVLLCGCVTQQDWQEAIRSNSVEGYNRFVAAHPNAQEASRAKLEIQRLTEAKAWDTARRENTVESYNRYISQYSGLSNQGDALTNLLTARERLKEFAAKKDWDEACAANTLDAYRSFSEKHPSSVYVSQAKSLIRQREEEEARQREFEQVAAAGNDDALIEYIKTSKTPQYDQAAVNKLREYKQIPNGQVIPWSEIPSVAAGGAKSNGEEYPCGVDMAAFSTRVYEGANTGWLTVGSRRFFKPDTALLNFKYWTVFEGFIAKGEALVKKEGLAFVNDSVLLKRQPKN